MRQIRCQQSSRRFVIQDLESTPEKIHLPQHNQDFTSRSWLQQNRIFPAQTAPSGRTSNSSQLYRGHGGILSKPTCYLSTCFFRGSELRRGSRNLILLTYSDIISSVNTICWQLHNDGVKSGSSHNTAYVYGFATSVRGGPLRHWPA